MVNKSSKVIFFASLGGVLELYDFIIYALLSSYLSYNFFPIDNKNISLTLTLATFAIGYVIRPLSGLIFGHQGDSIGRKKPFTLTVLMMALSTLLIGFLPTYHQVGMLAPLALIGLRVFQGFSVGGEIPGGITYLSEIAPKNKSTVCSLLFFCLVGGTVLGLCTNLILHSIYTTTQINAFAWRIPFIFGGILGLISFIIRKHLVESPVFESMLKEKTSFETKMPLKQLFKSSPREVVAGLFLTCSGASSVVVFFLLLPTFLGQLQNYPTDYILNSSTLGLTGCCATIVLFGYLVDRFNMPLKLCFGITCLATIFISIYVFQLFEYKVPNLLLPMVLSAISAGLFSSLIPTILSILFPANVRYSGIAFVYNISMATVGGLAPVISLSLIRTTHSVMAPGYYQAVLATLGFVGLWMLKDRRLELKSK